MAEELSADFAAVRALLLKHEGLQRQVADMAPHDTPAEPPPPLPATAPAAAETLRQLQAELSTVTDQLHAERAAVAQLRLQQRCDAATRQELLEESARAEATAASLSSQLAEWKRRGAAAEEAHAGCAAQYASVRAQVDGVQQCVREVQTQHTELRAAAAAAQRLVTTLTDEKAHLLGRLQARDAEVQELSSVAQDCAEARATAKALADRHEAWVAEVRAYTAYFEAAQEAYVRGLHHVVAVQQEHAALRDALARSEARCAAWEGLFAQTPRGTCAPCDRATLENTPSVVEVPEVSSSSSSARAEESRASASVSTQRSAACLSVESAAAAASPDAFVWMLEAKVADLALQLCDAQTRAAAAQRTADDVVRLSLADSAELMQLKSLVCALRPPAAAVAEHNAGLQARLLATEAFSDALLQHVLRLGEALADEACQRCWAVASIRGGGPPQSPLVPPTLRSTPAVAAAQPTPSRPSLVPGTRHRLRATALEPRQ